MAQSAKWRMGVQRFLSTSALAVASATVVSSVSVNTRSRLSARIGKPRMKLMEHSHRGGIMSEMSLRRSLRKILNSACRMKSWSSQGLVPS